MAKVTIVGQLAADPEVVQAGKLRIAKFTVLENTGERRAGEWVPDLKPISHRVEARFGLGESVMDTLNMGQRVVVVGDERDASYERDGKTTYGRVIHAREVGPTLFKGERADD